MTLRDIGRSLGVSYERVRQIERPALQKVAAALRERLGTAGLDSLLSDQPKKEDCAMASRRTRPGRLERALQRSQQPAPKPAPPTPPFAPPPSQQQD